MLNVLELSFSDSARSSVSCIQKTVYLRSGVPSSHNGFQRTLPNGGSVASPGGSSGIIPHPPNLLVNSHNGDSLLAGAHQQSGGAGGTHGNMGPHAEIMDHAQYVLIASFINLDLFCYPPQ